MSAPRYSPWILAAIALHAAIFYGWGTLFRDLPQFDLDGGGSMEIALVETASQATGSKSTSETSAVPPPAPEPTPAPSPEPTPNPEPAAEAAPAQAPEPAPTPAAPLAESKPRQRISSKPAGSTNQAGSLSQQAPGGSAGPIGSALKPRRNPRPPYPAESRQAGEQGSVILMISVTATGDVAAVRVQRSSGFPRLDEAARQTVEKRWKFQPARIGGIAAAGDALLTVRFVLAP